jgi:DNA anti-recombination protein RmuC
VAEEAERLRAQADQTASWNEAEAQRLRQQAQQLSADAKHHDDSILISRIEVRLALH